VAALLHVVFPLLPPLHPVIPPARPRKRNEMARMIRGLLLTRIPNSITQANTAPPLVFHGKFGPFELAAEHVPELEAVVEMVRTAEPGVAPLNVTGLVVAKLNTGGSAAFAGVLVAEAIKVTLPVNPPIGVIVIAEVFPVVAPGAMLTVEALILKPGVTGVDTEIVVASVAAA
jgi:hypothetical protein